MQIFTNLTFQIILFFFFLKALPSNVVEQPDVEKNSLLPYHPLSEQKPVLVTMDLRENNGPTCLFRFKLL